MTALAQEYEDVRTILRANYPQPRRIAWPGAPFDPDPAWPEWLDVDLNHGGDPPAGVDGPHGLLDFGGNTLRTMVLDIAICRRLGGQADFKARQTADAILAYPWTNTATMTYRNDVAYIGRSGPWGDAWWRVDLLMTIWREDA